MPLWQNFQFSEWHWLSIAGQNLHMISSQLMSDAYPDNPWDLHWFMGRVFIFASIYTSIILGVSAMGRVGRRLR